MRKNIELNHKFDEYNKKYKNRRYRLLKYTSKQVEDFDKQYGHYVFNGKTHSLDFEKYLLKNRKWWFIDGTYYEIPKPIRFTWFRNLSAGVQIATCALLVGGVTAAIVVPSVVLNNDKTEDRTIDVIGGDLKDAKPTKVGDTLVFDLTCKDEKQEVTEITEVTIGNVVLDPSDYTFDKDNHKLIIKKSGLDKAGEHDNISIKVTQGEKKVVYVTDVKCDDTKTLKVGDKISFDDLHVKITPDNATDKTFRVEKGGQNGGECLEIDNDKKEIRAIKEGTQNILVAPNGVNPEGEEMIAAYCEISVESTTKTAKERFLETLDSWTSGFVSTTKRYQKSDISNVVIENVSTAPKDLVVFYYNEVNRTLELQNPSYGVNAYFASFEFTSSSLSDKLLDEEDEHTVYTFSDDLITYKTDQVTGGDKYVSISFNKNGHMIENTYYKYGTDLTTNSVTYSNDIKDLKDANLDSSNLGSVLGQISLTLPATITEDSNGTYFYIDYYNKQEPTEPAKNVKISAKNDDGTVVLQEFGTFTFKENEQETFDFTFNQWDKISSAKSTIKLYGEIV